MGERKALRVKMVLPVRVSGTDNEGTPFSFLAHTLDFSRSGARLGGIRHALQVGETVTLEYKLRQARFAVRWVGPLGTRSEHQAGVQSLEPENFLWLNVPQQNYTDDVDPSCCRAAKDAIAAGSSPALKIEPSPGTVVEELLSTVDRVGGGESQPADRSTGADGHLDSGNPASVILTLEQLINANAIPLDDALELVAGNARLLLNGAGAAIALPQNDEMVCHASAGRAPAVGVHFRADTGLTAEAVRTGRTVTCHDTLRDSRVDSEVWSKVGIHSTICAPVALSEGGTAVLEVFAAQSYAFTGAHGIILQALAGLIGRAVARNASAGSRSATQSIEGA